MVAIINNRFWNEFFDLYCSLPVLWKVKSEHYKNKHQKKKAWNTLLDKYLEVDDCATITTLKSKIANIRTVYRRELKKIKASERFDEEDVYTPSIWYFNRLSFLKDQFEEAAATNASHLDITYQSTLNTISSGTKSHALKNERANMAQNFDNNASWQPEDDVDTYSKYWAARFRKLAPDQQFYARKAFEDILLLGDLNQLRMNTVKQKPRPNTSEYECERTCSSPRISSESADSERSTSPSLKAGSVEDPIGISKESFSRWPTPPPKYKRYSYLKQSDPKMVILEEWKVEPANETIESIEEDEAEEEEEEEDHSQYL